MILFHEYEVSKSTHFWHCEHIHQHVKGMIVSIEELSPICCWETIHISWFNNTKMGLAQNCCTKCGNLTISYSRDLNILGVIMLTHTHLGRLKNIFGPKSDKFAKIVGTLAVQVSSISFLALTATAEERSKIACSIERDGLFRYHSVCS